MSNSLNSISRTEYIVYCHIIEVRGIAARDRSETSDPYIVVRVNPSSNLEQTTSTKVQTVNAVYDCKMVFKLFLSKVQFQHEKVLFLLYDRNDIFKNEFLGVYELELSYINQLDTHCVENLWVPLNRPDIPVSNNKSKNANDNNSNKYTGGGVMLLSLFVLGPTDIPPTFSNYNKNTNNEFDTLETPLIYRRPYLLNVFLYRARDLPTQSTNSKGGLPNCFINVRFNGTALQTNTIFNNFTPVYNTRLSFPFFLPLHSHSISIQVWQNCTKSFPPLPDRFISEVVFYQSDVASRSIGPKWVPLYSTLKEKGLFSVAPFSETNLFPTEYTGSVLLSLSVKVHDNPRLEVGTCPSILEEPPLDEYCLMFALYSAFEIPVSGGKLFAELVFGDTRIRSNAISGKKGTFIWNPELFPPIFGVYPTEITQVPDVMINLYHSIGFSDTKIAYLNLPASILKDGSSKYKQPPSCFSINGDKSDGLFEKDWKPLNAGGNWVIDFSPRQWIPLPRVLKHVNEEAANSRVIPGMLQFSIGFGLKQSIQEWLYREKSGEPRLPPFIIPSPIPYTLTAYFYTARNLPAVYETGLSNPYFLLRLGYTTVSTNSLSSTVNPVICKSITSSVSISWDFHPCIYLSAYSNDNFSDTFLCSTRIELSPDTKFLNQPQKYILEIQDDSLEDIQAENHNKSRPSVVALFSLVQENTEKVATDSVAKNFLTSLSYSDYVISFSILGIRRLIPISSSSLSNKCKVVISCPTFTVPDNIISFNDDNIIVSEETITLDDIQALEKNQKNKIYRLKVHLPSNPVLFESFSVSIFLYTANLLSDDLIGSCYIPLNDIMYKEQFIQPKQKNKKTKKTQLEEKGSGISISESPMIILEEPAESYLTTSLADYDNAETELIEKFSSPGTYTNINASNVFNSNEDDEEIVLDELENELLEIDSNSAVAYHSYPLKRGKTTGFSSIETYLTSPSAMYNNGNYQIGILKGFFLAGIADLENDFSLKLSYLTKSGEDKFRKLRNDKNEYTIVIYVFRAINLHHSSSWNSSVNPYIVVKSEDTSISFSEACQIENNSPEFYQTVTLPNAILPKNHLLEVQLWSRDSLFSGSDAFLGSTKIDIEDRILSDEWQKRKFPDDRKNTQKIRKEWRTVYNTASSVGQGKIELKVDVLKLHEQPEDLFPPPPEDMELRLVLWSSSRIRHLDDNDSDDINQFITVTANFDGNEEITLETDKAWSIKNGGEAIWNYRMKFNLTLPCRLPRLTISLWDYSTVSTGNGTLLGQIIYNLSPWIDNHVKRDGKEKRVVSSKKDLFFSHPKYSNIQQGTIKLQCYLVSKSYANNNPVGSGQDEPNEDPYLPAPARNLPPYAVFSKSIAFFGWFAKHKILLMTLLFIIILAPLLGPILFEKLSSYIF